MILLTKVIPTAPMVDMLDRNIHAGHKSGKGVVKSVALSIESLDAR